MNLIPMNPLVKKKLSILVRLADIDGEFAKIEKSFIEDIALKNGVKENDLNQLINNPEPIGSLGALSYEKSVEYLCDSLSLIAIDNKILPSEVILCEDIGLRLGFQKSGIDGIIERLKANPSLPSKKVEEEVRRLPHNAK